MKTWRLEAVHALRTRVEQRAAVEHGQAVAALEAAAAAARAARAALATSTVPQHATTAGDLERARHFAGRLRAAAREASTRAAELRAAAARARAAMIAARRDREVLDLARRRHHDERRRALASAEDDHVDEGAGTRRSRPHG